MTGRRASLRASSLVVVALAGWLATGCGDDSTATATNATSVGVGGFGGADGAGGAGGEYIPKAGMQGTVYKMDGTPLEEAPIQLCAIACYLGFTDADGAFSYASVPSGHYKLDVRGPNDGTEYGAVNFPLELLEDEMHVLSAPLHVPVTGAGVQLAGGVQQVVIDSTLTVTIDLAELVFPVGVTEQYLAGVRVPLDKAPPNQPPSGSVVAWWSLNPFGTLASAPQPFTIVNDMGLTADAAVAIYSVSDQTGEMVLETNATVSSDGSSIEVSGGAGLSQVTWLAVVTP